jgi:hypothetical protein
MTTGAYEGVDILNQVFIRQGALAQTGRTQADEHKPQGEITVREHGEKMDWYSNKDSGYCGQNCIFGLSKPEKR